MPDPEFSRQNDPAVEADGPVGESSAEPRSFSLFGNDDHDVADPDRESVEVRGSGACADDVEDECDPRQEALLDEGVEETFPASDPVSVKRIT